MRQSRKLEHLKYALLLPDGPASAGFEDLVLVHNCLPDISWSDICLHTNIAGIDLPHPVIINAVTGGDPDVTEVNAQIATLAKITHSLMAVGSQYAALERPEAAESYQIIRKINPDGIVIANLGAHVTPCQAKEAVDMIAASAIQIHLNPAQEIYMAEGDRDFSGYLDNIRKIVKASKVPVIVKEVGCGIALEQAKKLIEAGVQAIDVGGAGGTNFLAIEAARSKRSLSKDNLTWGIPTVASALEVHSVLKENVSLIVSGGVRTPLDAVKALAIGGSAVAMAAPVIRILRDKSIDYAVEWFNQFLDDMKRYMILLGAKSVKDVSSKIPVIIDGYTRNWLNARGIDPQKYSLR